MLDFVLAVRPSYDANWHHKRLCAELDDFVAGKTKRLMVFMPPRHGKSELVSRCLPAFIFGRNPRANIIAASYSADLAQMMNRDVQRIIDSPDYARVFPATYLNRDNIRTVSGSWLRNSDLFETVGFGGVYRCAGVGGGITGMGAEYVVIDDPIKNLEEAYSPTYREKLWGWYTSTLYTRLQGHPGAILITVTRWHEDDLAGRLLEMAEKSDDADRWRVVSWPAVKEGAPNEDDPRADGEALWPGRFPLERLCKIRGTVPHKIWQSLYQQTPCAEQGTYIQRAWFETRWETT